MNFTSFTIYYSLFHIYTCFSLHEQSPSPVNIYFLLFPYNLFLLGYWIRKTFYTVLGLLGRGVKWTISNSCAYAKRIHIKKYCITLVHFLNAVSKNWKRSYGWEKKKRICLSLYIHICTVTPYTLTHIYVWLKHV